MIITEFVTTKMGGRNIKHYKSLGYKVKLYQEITVPVSHLPSGSHEIIDVSCDFCGSVVRKAYKTILIERSNSVVKKDCCIDCIPIKISESNMINYGVTNVMQVEEIRQRLENTLMDRYGVRNVTMNEGIKDRATYWSKNMTDDQKNERWEKTKKTNLERYGVECCLQTPQAKRSMFETRSAESSQQAKVCDILSKIFSNISRNFSYNTLSLDMLIEIDEIKIDVEYDSWYWHEKDRDRRRDEFLKGEGFKILRIKSGKKIPTEIQLLYAIDALSKTNRKYFEIKLEDWNEEGYLERRAE